VRVEWRRRNAGWYQYTAWCGGHPSPDSSPFIGGEIGYLVFLWMGGKRAARHLRLAPLSGESRQRPCLATPATDKVLFKAADADEQIAGVAASDATQLLPVAPCVSARIRRLLIRTGGPRRTPCGGMHRQRIEEICFLCLRPTVKFRHKLYRDSVSPASLLARSPGVLRRAR
jgi:hypothetical protein